MTSRSENPVESIKEEIQSNLSVWASQLVLSDLYSVQADPYRVEFAWNPNNPAMHSMWHQWGIVKHMIRAEEALERTVPGLIAERVDPDSTDRLNLEHEDIDGIPKWDLLRLATITHDAGKFTQRRYSDNHRGPVFNFGGHEFASGLIVRQWHDRFTGLGLSDEQTEYIARCTELHYVLGNARSAAKQTTEGYTIGFTTSAPFREVAQSIRSANPDYQREIGIIFLADSLAKTDILAGLAASTDEENEMLLPVMEAEIAQRGLSATLLPAAQQVAINMAAGTDYLKTITR